MNNWQVKINTPVDRLGVQIFIFRVIGNQSIEVRLPSGDSKIIDRGMPFEPTIYLEPELFQEIVDSIHKDFKPSEGKFTEGKLEGTERHLKDLRQLLKLK